MTYSLLKDNYTHQHTEKLSTIFISNQMVSHLSILQVYKALHRHAVLSSPPTATASASSATMAALQDRLNVLGYLCSNAHSAEVCRITCTSFSFVPRPLILSLSLSLSLSLCVSLSVSLHSLSLSLSLSLTFPLFDSLSDQFIRSPLPSSYCLSFFLPWHPQTLSCLSY